MTQPTIALHDARVTKIVCSAAYVIGSLFITIVVGGLSAVTWWVVGAVGVGVAWAINGLIDIIPDEDGVPDEQ